MVPNLLRESPNHAEPESFREASSSSEAAADGLRVSELRYRRLFESARDGILILDFETGQITDANPFMSELLGYSHEELLGKELWEIGLLKDQSASKNSFAKLKKDGSIRYDALPLQNRSGSKREVEFVSNVYTEDQQLVVQCNIRDITKRKRAEFAQRESERFAQSTVDGLSAAIAVLDKHGTILAVNQAWRQFAKQNPPVNTNLAEGANYLLVCDTAVGIDSEEARQAADGIRAVIAGSRDAFTLEYPCHSPTTQRWFRLRVSPFQNDNLSRVVVSHENITEQKLAEQEMEQFLADALKLADSDPLTGLLNHRAFHDRLDAEFARAERVGSTYAIVMLDIDNFKFFNDVYNHGTGDDVLRLVAKHVKGGSRPEDSVARLGGDEFALLLPDVGIETAEDIESRVRENLASIFWTPDQGGTTIPITVSVGAALHSSDFLNRHECLRLADERMQWFKAGGNVEALAKSVRSAISDQIEGFAMLDALVVAVDNKDRYTRRHSEDVMYYSLMIATELNLDEPTKHTLSVAALIHDVGKIGVPDSVLRKPGALADDEFEIIKRHAQMGLIMVTAVPGLEDTHDVVHHHHERMDGKGYPFGLKGEDIPFNARLVAVADAFSAMTTDRPYRKGMGRQQALDILHKGRGSQWDARCVDAFQSAFIKSRDGAGLLRDAH